MHTFEEFKKEVMEHFPEYLPERYKNSVMEVNEVVKENDKRYTALLIRQNGEKVSPNIYLEDYYKDYERDGSMEAALEKISVDYQMVVDRGIPQLKFDVSDYEQVKPRLYVAILNADYNQEYLKDACTKNIPETDITAVARVLCDNTETEGRSSFVVKENHAKMWNVSPEEICEEALKNTQRLFPAELKNMREMLAEVMMCNISPTSPAYSKENRDILEMMPYEQYVLTNTEKINGAAALLYPGLLKEIAEKAGGNFFILPSSIHDVILIKDTGELNAEELQCMVMDVNRTQVLPEEVLSDEVYYYDRKEERVIMATDKEHTQEVVDRFSDNGIVFQDIECEQENGEER